jgi:hypothetical protein
LVKVEQSLDDLKKHLKEQVDFLCRSAEAYDRGCLDEAKRLAATIRILVHDTKNSTSLLSQLNLKGIYFLDTSADYTNSIFGSFSGLALREVRAESGISEGVYIPRFYRSGNPSEPYTWKPFNIWWEKIVIVDHLRQDFSRKEIILTLANKEGGAHIDPSIEEDYAELTRKNSMRWFTMSGGDSVSINGIEHASCREIAHEVYISLEVVGLT